ncbi:hypothetical protein DFJ58DRAFT_736699, partial [Suillus subalutaceus]|uniref:uncharacterized protein n=1 Tax=Suillus subalutaceus TaxID=48586 RepID=UPI001B87F54C
MPSQSATTPPTRHTRPTNATAHPDEKATQAAAQAAAVEAGAKCVAGIELEMEAKQIETLMRKAKGVCPRPTPYKGKKAVNDIAASAGGSGNLADEDEVPMDIDCGENDQDPCSEVKKKVTKMSMKDVVNRVCDQIKWQVAVDGDKAGACADKKGNSLGTSVVQNWASGIKTQIGSQNLDTSHVTHTSASPPPSTIFSRLTSSSRTTHSVIPADIPKGPLEACVPDDALVEGFTDSEDEGDELERLAAHGITAKEGRSASAVAVTLTVDSSDEEFELPAELCAPFTQMSPKGPSSTAAPSSILKRKASEDLDLVPGSEIKDFSDDAPPKSREVDQKHTP